MLFSLGRGVEGIVGTGHGAVVALMLDEVMAAVAAEVFGRHGIITGALEVRFKRRLETPRVVLARASLKRVQEEAGAEKDRKKLEFFLGRWKMGKGEYSRKVEPFSLGSSQGCDHSVLMEKTNSST
jgi:hypothetical protein